ncbi:hypothetical protein Q31b_57660 [Novipirellula aureliae]|uniref:IrrE N-terminal-like domain-containing protein n=1 Tax=Novipirellula aureliae TaxID=2527966 RepID=A0A5C6DET3_9BACT|nr:ImmA/IrrE family metallo-endopeptidase [Novipirellula aureliae]TWU33449.1 hypothetical protein Q31b_57660 [Novipirellula aureliae]
MISLDEVESYAAEHFPAAPEKLVNDFGIEVRTSDTPGCDGWCLHYDDRTIIRLNGELTKAQRRFTLAHELGHLILGIPSMFGESFEDMLSSDSDEERRVNDVASCLLLPLAEVRKDAGQLPVVAGALKRLAKRARVSELAAAVRVCNLTEELGLLNASVVAFSGADIRWQWSRTLRMSEETAFELRQEAQNVSPNAFRADHNENQTVVASVLENPFFGSSTLFVQLLPKEHGNQLSVNELRAAFEREYLSSDDAFRNRLSGIIGAFKSKCVGLSQEEAVELFWEKNEARLRSTCINTDEGRDYIEIRIGQLL